MCRASIGAGEQRTPGPPPASYFKCDATPSAWQKFSWGSRINYAAQHRPARWPLEQTDSVRE